MEGFDHSSRVIGPRPDLAIIGETQDSRASGRELLNGRASLVSGLRSRRISRRERQLSAFRYRMPPIHAIEHTKDENVPK